MITDDIPLHMRKIARDHGCGGPGAVKTPMITSQGGARSAGFGHLNRGWLPGTPPAVAIW